MMCIDFSEGEQYMKIKYIYTDEVTNALNLIDDAICTRKQMIRNELEQKLPFKDGRFHKYFREACVNDYVIKQLQDKKDHIIMNALPVKILLEE